MNIEQVQASLKKLDVLVLPCLKRLPNRQMSYQNMSKACEALMKNLVKKYEKQICYTLEDEQRQFKIWNGSGMQVGSLVMRHACRNKDIVMIVKQQAEQKSQSQQIKQQTPKKLPKKLPLISPTSPSPNSQTSKINIRSMQIFNDNDKNYSQEEISTIIRKVNRTCIIGFVYVDASGHFDVNLDGKGEQSGGVNSLVGVIPKIQTDNQQYQILISRSSASTNYTQPQDNQVLSQIIDDISIYYKNSSKSLTYLSERLSRKRSSILWRNHKLKEMKKQQSVQGNQKITKPQLQFQVYRQSSIHDIFSCCFPRRKTVSNIKLIKTSPYNHQEIVKIQQDKLQSNQKWPQNLHNRNKNL